MRNHLTDMQRRRFLSLLPFPLLAQQEPPPIRVEVNLVNVPFAVYDGSGRLIPDLKAEDFEITEDGQPQKIQFFSRAADSPLTLAVVADVSGSQDDFVGDHRRDLRDFLKSVMKPQDQAMLLCFGANVWMVSPAGAPPGELHERLKEFQKGDRKDARRVSPQIYRDGSSSVYDGVYEAAKALRELPGRRAIILFSDGEDTSSAHHLLETIEICQEYAVTFFPLRYTELRKGRDWSARNLYGRSMLSRLALETGGVDYDASEDDALRRAFAQIAEILRSSYDLAYTSTQPERDSTFRKIRIKPKNPNLRVRHKTGYYARPN
jgi:Ca-activated chloride channel homolog